EKSAAERADDECSGRRIARILIQQLVEALGLTFVVAEDDRRDLVADQTPQALDVTVDRLGRAEGKDDVGLLGRGIDEAERAELRERAARLLRRLEQL